MTSIGPYLSRTPNIFLYNITSLITTTALLYTGWLRVESAFYGLFLTFKIDPYCHFLFRVSFQNVSWLIRVLRNGMSAVYSWLSLTSNFFVFYLCLFALEYQQINCSLYFFCWQLPRWTHMLNLVVVIQTIGEMFCTREPPSLGCEANWVIASRTKIQTKVNLLVL